MSQRTSTTIHWKLVIAAVAVIWLVHAVVIQMLAGIVDRGQMQHAAFGYLIIMLLAGCFAVVGCAGGRPRFGHVFLVALGLWFSETILLFSPTYSAHHWLIRGMTLLISLLLGWVLSLFLVWLHIPRVLRTWTQGRSRSTTNAVSTRRIGKRALLSANAQGQIPTGTSIAFAFVTAMLFRTGNAKVAWVVIVVGALVLGFILRNQKRKQEKESDEPE